MASYWYNRGAKGAADNKSPLFRNTRRAGITPTCEGTEFWTRDEEVAAGREYLKGYEKNLNCHVR